MKISEQRLKEIIIQEYNMVLLESAISNDLIPIIEKFVNEYISQRDKGNLGPEYMDLVRRAAGLMNTMRQITTDYLKKKMRKSRYVSMMSRINSEPLRRANDYGRVLALAVANMREFIESMVRPGKGYDQKALSETTKYLSIAIRNMADIENYKIPPGGLTSATDDTQPFEREDSSHTAAHAPGRPIARVGRGQEDYGQEGIKRGAEQRRARGRRAGAQ